MVVIRNQGYKSQKSSEEKKDMERSLRVAES